MTLVHYACEYGSSRFLKALCKARGPIFFLKQVCASSRTSRHGIHFLARNHCTKELELIMRVVTKFHQSAQSAKWEEDSISKILAEALKQPDETPDRNTALHTSLQGEFRLPEELCVDFEENFELSESHYGGKPLLRQRKVKTHEQQYSALKVKLKEAFVLRLIDFATKLGVAPAVFKQPNSAQFCALELALKMDHLQVLKRMLRTHPSLMGIKLGNQNTILHLAAKLGQSKTVGYLLSQWQVDLQGTNLFNQTAFQLAFQEGNLEVCELIRKHAQSESAYGAAHSDSEAFVGRELSRNQGEAVSLRGHGFKMKDVLVHIDLKGAPPRFEFLVEYVKYVATQFEFLVTGFVFEFEDMFPYEGNLASVRSHKAYSCDQIKYLVALLKRRKLKLVVLVQTFGHLEYVLKRSRFADYREQPDNPISICSLHKGAIDLIGSLLSQVVDLIGVENIDLVHIGADEVFNFASCRECLLFAQQASEKMLFSRWLTKVVKLLAKRYPSLQVMAWDDMFRNWSGADLMMLQTADPSGQSRRAHRLQPCVWAYSGNKQNFEATVSETTLHQACLEFKRVWIASAWQGAKEPSASFVDFEQRLHNQRLWLDRLENSVHKRTFREAIQGAVVTGWTRFTHQTVLCELLPMSVPSLALCLKVLETRKFNLQVLYAELVDSLRLQPRKLLQDIEQLYQASTLRQFLKESPWMRQSKREAKQRFCNDAFEISWLLHKGLFLLGQVEATMKDWTCHDTERHLTEQLNRHAYPQVMHQELSRLIGVLLATRRSQAQEAKKLTQDQVGPTGAAQPDLLGRTAHELKDSDSMELDESASYNEPPLDRGAENTHQHPQILHKNASIDTSQTGYAKLRALTSSSEDSSGRNPAQEDQSKTLFDFEDRIHGTLRTQLYKQLRGCVKLFRKAALLSEKVLPRYLFKEDIEEFRNCKILPHLLRAYEKQMSLFKASYIPKVAPKPLKPHAPRSQSSLLNLAQNQWSKPNLAVQQQVFTQDQMGQRMAFKKPVFKSKQNQPAQNEVQPQLSSSALTNKEAQSQSKANQKSNPLLSRSRVCQTPDLRPKSATTLLLSGTQKLDSNPTAMPQAQILATNFLSLDEIPLKTSVSDMIAAASKANHQEQRSGADFGSDHLQSRALQTQIQRVPNIAIGHGSNSDTNSSLNARRSHDESSSPLKIDKETQTKTGNWQAQKRSLKLATTSDNALSMDLARSQRQRVLQSSVFAVPFGPFKTSSAQLQLREFEGEGGLELNRVRKRENKVLRKRLAPHQRLLNQRSDEQHLEFEPQSLSIFAPRVVNKKQKRSETMSIFSRVNEQFDQLRTNNEGREDSLESYTQNAHSGRSAHRDANRD